MVLGGSRATPDHGPSLRFPRTGWARSGRRGARSVQPNAPGMFVAGPQF